MSNPSRHYIYNWGEFISKDEIIAGLLDNVENRRVLIPRDGQDSIFEHDALVMEEAVKLTIQQEREVYRLRRRRLLSFRPYKGKCLKEG